MTERLQRIHTILRAGQVPCGLSSAPGGGVVLHAGDRVGGEWDVLVHDTGGELWIVDSRGAVLLPGDSTDAAIGDAVKLHIVQAWADQGNPEAKALIARLQSSAAHQGSASRRPTNQAGPDVLASVTALVMDPLSLAGRMFDTASRLGVIFLTPPASAVVTVWSPWGTVQVGYTRH